MSEDYMDAVEVVASRRPFVVRRRVRWGECDPAGVVYTGRFTDYLLSAVMLFMDDLMGGPSEQYRAAHNIQTPCKGMSLLFQSALWPADVFEMRVRVGEIRSSSFDLMVTATQPDGTPVFEGRFSPICIPAAERRAIPIPPDLKSRLEAAERA